jgi:hypothetical protein
MIAAISGSGCTKYRPWLSLVRRSADEIVARARIFRQRTYGSAGYAHPVGVAGDELETVGTPTWAGGL